MTGFIKLNRSLLQWEWYSDIKTCRVFLHLLMIASYKEMKYKGRIVPRGATVSTVPELAKETGLTEREMRTSLSHLVKAGELTVKTTNRESLFTLLNYGVYADGEEDERQANDGQTSGKRQANVRQTTGVQNNKYNKYNNYNNTSRARKEKSIRREKSYDIDEIERMVMESYKS